MTYTVAFAPRARDQLIKLEAYIAEAASPAVAERYTDAVIGFCYSLSTFLDDGGQVEMGQRHGWFFVWKQFSCQPCQSGSA